MPCILRKERLIYDTKKYFREKKSIYHTYENADGYFGGTYLLSGTVHDSIYSV